MWPNNIRVGVIDPASVNDAFAFLGVNFNDRKMYVIGANRYFGSYSKSEDAVYKNIHLVNPFNLYVVEQNSVGLRVIDELRRKGMNVQGVTTTGAKTESDKETMNKEEAINNAIRMKDDGVIIFPKEPTPEIEEVKRQLQVYSGHRSSRTLNTGKMDYGAPSGDHDDYVSCLLLAVHVGVIRGYVGKYQGVKIIKV